MSQHTITLSDGTVGHFREVKPSGDGHLRLTLYKYDPPVSPREAFTNALVEAVGSSIDSEERAELALLAARHGMNATFSALVKEWTKYSWHGLEIKGHVVNELYAHARTLVKGD